MGITTSWYCSSSWFSAKMFPDIGQIWSHHWWQKGENGGKNAMTLINFVPFTDKPETLWTGENEALLQEIIVGYVKTLVKQEWDKRNGRNNSETKLSSTSLFQLPLPIFWPQDCLKEWQMTMFWRTLSLVSWARNIYLHKYIFLLYLIL